MLNKCYNTTTGTNPYYWALTDPRGGIILNKCYNTITGTNPYYWALTDPRGGIMLNKCYNTTTGTNPYYWALTDPRRGIMLNKCYNTITGTNPYYWALTDPRGVHVRLPYQHAGMHAHGARRVPVRSHFQLDNNYNLHACANSIKSLVIFLLYISSIFMVFWITQWTCSVTIWRANNTVLLKLVVKLNATVCMNNFIF